MKSLAVNSTKPFKRVCVELRISDHVEHNVVSLGSCWIVTMIEQSSSASSWRLFSICANDDLLAISVFFIITHGIWCIYIYIYVCVCVCACMYVGMRARTHRYIYIYNCCFVLAFCVGFFVVVVVVVVVVCVCGRVCCFLSLLLFAFLCCYCSFLLLFFKLLSEMLIVAGTLLIEPT